MPTNFPTAVDSFSTKLDGVSDVLAADINNMQDAIVAIQELLGTKEAHAGRVALFAKSSIPPGWIKANGATLTRSVYPDLWAAVNPATGGAGGAGNGTTTFTIPDLRGEFLRGWDDGRGADSGRAIGSTQDQTFASHTHGIAGNGAGAVQILGSQSGIVAGISPGGVPSTYYTTFGGSNILQAAGSGSETRPRNVALLACIKY